MNKQQGKQQHKQYRHSARELALQVLLKIEQKGAYSNLLLHQTITRYALDRKEVALLTELVYGTVQRKNTLDYYLEQFVKKGINKLEHWVLMLLRISLYQIVYLDKIPTHAVVNEAVIIAKRKGHRGIAGMVNGVLRNIVRNQKQLVLPHSIDPVERIALQYSHPTWLVSRWIKQYGQSETEAICKANLHPPQVSARVNRLQKDKQQLLSEMRQTGLDVTESAIAPEGFFINKGGNLANSIWYERGELTIQDESAMLPAEWLAPEPGMKVLDACAAPGGKTTQIAEMMNDQGEIWANDIHAQKEKLIAQQISRLGLTSVKTCTHDARQLHQRFSEESFDCVLLDAPCSGFGVIRRKPDLKWRKQEQDVHNIAKIQYEILHSVSKLVRSGGVIVYSTCTMDKLENEQNIYRFLKENPSWQLDANKSGRIPDLLFQRCSTVNGMVQILPHHFGSDGFFMARMRKT